MTDEEIPVLIVGGSLVGLTTAMLLGHHGVPSLSVERHAGTAIHPRAGHFQLRTMEVIRQMGLEDAGAREVAGDLQPDGRHHRGRVARGTRARHLRPGAQRGRRGIQPHRPRLHQPGRARADPARACARARRDGPQPHRGGRRGAGRRRRDGHAARPRLRGRAHGARALRRRRRRQSQPDARRGWASACAAIRSSRAASPSTSAPTAPRCCATATRASSTCTTRELRGFFRHRPQRRQRLPRHQHGG